MQKKLEQGQQASSEIRKKELKRKRFWTAIKWLLFIAKSTVRVIAFFEGNNLDEE